MAAEGNNPRRTLMDYTIPSIDSCRSSTVRPNVEANNFELKPALIQLVQDKAKQWLNAQPQGSITTWEDLMEKLEVAAMSNQVETTITCGLCRDAHENQNCCLLRDETPLEQANYMGNQPRQPYDLNSNTYNSGWRNHPNLGWGGN
ncbi:hypothetical protein PIB30_084003 [Stylosanthes scabra]|uniref:Retrotransposon gag protein n=1 Tax=Stylosanthes scabra TaxID=79078 RepID=A0ABU6ZR21_9FABA|nr:hypothetical protein [Stylosanthes scabra]